MTSLAALPTPAGIAAMQSINKVILGSSFMPLFFATSLGSLGLGIWGATHWDGTSSRVMLLGGLVYVLGMFVCTAACNVPLNEALDRVDPASAPAAEVWADYLRSWTRWNHLRTISSITASALFLVSAWT